MYFPKSQTTPLIIIVWTVNIWVPPLQTCIFKPVTQVIYRSYSCSQHVRVYKAKSDYTQDEWVTELAPVFTTLWCSITVGCWPLLSQPLPLENYSRRNSGWLLVLCRVSSIFWKNESFSCAFHLFHCFPLSTYIRLCLKALLVCSFKRPPTHSFFKELWPIFTMTCQPQLFLEQE